MVKKTDPPFSSGGQARSSVRARRSQEGLEERAWQGTRAETGELLGV